MKNATKAATLALALTGALLVTGCADEGEECTDYDTVVTSAAVVPRPAPAPAPRPAPAPVRPAPVKPAPAKPGGTTVVPVPVPNSPHVHSICTEYADA